MMWGDVVTITLDPNAPAVEVTDPLMFITNTVTETITSVSETTITNTDIWETPFLEIYPHDLIIDIDPDTGKAYPYNLTWVIFGSSYEGNWGSVTLDGNPLWVIEGPWISEVPIVIQAQGPGLNKGFHTYELNAYDQKGYTITHEVYVSVLNMTGFIADNPDIVSSLSEEYGGVPPQIAPFPYFYSIIGLGAIVLRYRKFKSIDRI